MKNLVKKLNEIQRKLVAPKSQTNQAVKFKYRKAEDILQAIKPLMGTEHAVTLSDRMEEGYVVTTAALTDGEHSISAQAVTLHPTKIMSMSDPQLSGTASTYGHKVALGNLFMIDSSEDIDERNQYAEEVEQFAQMVQDNETFKLYMLTTRFSPEAHKAVWDVYKIEYIPHKEIGIYRERIRDLTAQGRAEALAAQEAFDSEDDTLAAEAKAEYTTDEIDFINSINQ